MLNIHSDLDDSRVGSEAVLQISESLPQRLSSPQSEDLERADREYQQLLDIMLVREIDGQLVELGSFCRPRTEYSIQSACEILIATLTEFRRKYNKNRNIWG